MSIRRLTALLVLVFALAFFSAKGLAQNDGCIHYDCGCCDGNYSFLCGNSCHVPEGNGICLQGLQGCQSSCTQGIPCCTGFCEPPTFCY
jgi:hypothetical protein